MRQGEVDWDSGDDKLLAYYQYHQLNHSYPLQSYVPVPMLGNVVGARGMGAAAWRDPRPYFGRHYGFMSGMGQFDITGDDGVSTQAEYYGDAGVPGSDAWITSSGSLVNQDGAPLTEAQAAAVDNNMSTVPTAAAAGTGQQYAGVDSKGNDVWIASSGPYQGKFVNQDGLPITPVGSVRAEGGGALAVGSSVASKVPGMLAPAATSTGGGLVSALLAPGPAPRVTVPAAAPAMSVLPGFSNTMLMAGAGLLLFAVLMGKK